MGPIVNADDLEWTETEREDTHIKRKQLGDAAGGQRLGTSLYELPAERQAWPYHYHTGNEEAIYVLDGEGTIRLDGEQHALEAGDYVALPAGEDSAHQVINDSEGVLRYLVVSTMDDPDVMGYPDSGKVGVTAGDPPGGDPGERSASSSDSMMQSGSGTANGDHTAKAVSTIRPAKPLALLAGRSTPRSRFPRSGSLRSPLFAISRLAPLAVRFLRGALSVAKRSPLSVHVVRGTIVPRYPAPESGPHEPSRESEPSLRRVRR